jgi:pyridoxine kinase
VTSVETAETPPGSMDMLCSEGGQTHLLRTPRLDLRINGAGDAIAALFLFHRLKTGSTPQAMAEAGSSIHGLLLRTHEAGSREILTVAAQDEFISPTRRFLPIAC